MKCIFCNVFSERTNIEHIIPESFAGNDEYTFKNGEVCNKCNAYFSKIENIALNDYPFKMVRVLLGFPTKKKKLPIIKSSLGSIWALPGSRLKHLSVNENSIGNEGVMIQKGPKEFELVYSMEISDKLSVCKMILKIGLEYLAFKYPDLHTNKNYDQAKEFARYGKRGERWSFAIYEDKEQFEKYMINGIKEEDDDVFDVGLYGKQIPQVFHFRFAGITIGVPLVMRNRRKVNDKKIRIFDVVI
jgi:hypothetical protein